MSFFHKHVWSRWKDNGLVVWYYAGHVGERAWQTRQAMEQIRECQDCGKKQKRHV